MQTTTPALPRQASGHVMDVPTVSRVTNAILQLPRQEVSRLHRRMGRNGRERHSRMLTGRECWCFLLARLVRQRGESLDNSARVYHQLDAWCTAGIEGWFGEGCTVLCVLDGHPWPRLVPPSAPFIKNFQMAKKAKQPGFQGRLLVFDTELLWKQIATHLELVHGGVAK